MENAKENLHQQHIVIKPKNINKEQKRTTFSIKNKPKNQPILKPTKKFMPETTWIRKISEQSYKAIRVWGHGNVYDLRVCACICASVWV